MKTFIYSDPHLGLSRKANYTEASSKAREQWVTVELTKLLEASVDAGHGLRLCLGDFFEKESVSEQVLLDSLPIVAMTDVIMAGNHDLSNRVGKATSFAVLKEIAGDKVLIADQELNQGFSAVSGSTVFCFAPHAITQAGYVAMIEDLVKEAAAFPGYRILCLHCNWDMDPERLSDSTLNLTPEFACELLATFHTILIGHVHTPQEIYGGRVKLIGSVFPTAFDNLDSKRALVYDTETGEFTDFVTWDAEASYYCGPASECPPDLKQYYELFDDLPAGESQKIVVDLFKEGAFGVKLTKKVSAEELQAVSVAQLLRLPETIATELQQHRPHLVPLWEEISRE